MSMKVEDKLFLDRFRVDEESHLRILDGSLCLKECPEKDRIAVAYEGCLECGSCRIGCPHLNIEWRFPRGGHGISHKFG